MIASSLSYYDVRLAQENGQKQTTAVGNNFTTSNQNTSNSNQNALPVVTFSSPYVKEFSLPNGTLPSGIVVDNKGVAWTVGGRFQSLYAVDPATGNVKSFPVPNASSISLGLVWAMTEGRNQSILFSGNDNARLWWFDQARETFQEIKSPSAAPFQMKTDPVTGNIWYTLLYSGKLGVLEKGNGTHPYIAKEFDMNKESLPSGLFLAQNSNLGPPSLIFVSKVTDNKIVEYSISYENGTGRVIGISKTRDIPSDNTTRIFSPTDVAYANGSLYFTEHETSFLTEYNLTSNVLTRFPTMLHPINTITLPYWLARDTQGRGVWFNEHEGNRISFFSFSDKTLTEYEVPSRIPVFGNIVNVLTIAADPTNKDRLWFTELSDDKIGFVDRSVPISFDIDLQLRSKEIVFQKGQMIDIRMGVMNVNGTFSKTLSFNVSSSTSLTGQLANMTAKVSPSTITLSQSGSLPENHTVLLSLQNVSLQHGRYTLGISCTDGMVTRTIYLNLMVP